jgi:FtsH-binding integral membrane protein
MEPTTTRDAYGRPVAAKISSYMSQVYAWMTLGILLTGFVAYVVSNDESILTAIISNKMIFYGLIIAEVGLVIVLGTAINRINSLTALSVFLLYSALNGATLSIFSLVYTQASIQSAFFTTAFSFAGLSAFGFITKKDLGPVGNFCTMGLFGLVGLSLLSIFWPSLMGGMMGQIYGLVGIIVFAGLTAYDTQMIKNLAPMNGTREDEKKGAIMGALKLYLDFINLFIFILRLTGNRRK